MTEGYRVVARTAVQITPPPPHLADSDEHHALVAEVMTLRVNNVEELETLLPGVLGDLAVAVAANVTAHPRRPSWRDKHHLEFLEFNHRVNVGDAPGFTPTPPDPGHTPGSWLDCPRCRTRLTEDM